MDHLPQQFIRAFRTLIPDGKQAGEISRPAGFPGFEIGFPAPQSGQFLGIIQRLFAFAECLFGLFLLGDVDHYARPSGHFAIFAYRPGFGMEPSDIALFRNSPELDIIVLNLVRVPEVFHQPGPVVGINQAQEVLADHLRDGVTRHFLEHRAHVGDGAEIIDFVNDVVYGFNQVPVHFFTSVELLLNLQPFLPNAQGADPISQVGGQSFKQQYFVVSKHMGLVAINLDSPENHIVFVLERQGNTRIIAISHGQVPPDLDTRIAGDILYAHRFAGPDGHSGRSVTINRLIGP